MIVDVVMFIAVIFVADTKGREDTLFECSLFCIPFLVNSWHIVDI